MGKILFKTGKNSHVEDVYVPKTAVELEKRSRRRELRARNGG